MVVKINEAYVGSCRSLGSVSALVTDEVVCQISDVDFGSSLLKSPVGTAPQVYTTMPCKTQDAGSSSAQACRFSQEGSRKLGLFNTSTPQGKRDAF